MKKKILICILSVLALTGCKKDSMENITIYTSTYPIEYITKELYEDHSTVNSIYPNEIINLSDKLIKDYSTANLFVYNGLSNEKEYAVKMLNNNKNLMIVDASMGMEIEKRTEELWLNPSNFLMLCLNIKNGMKEYITNSYLRKEIDNNYDELYLKVSELDAELKLLVENADDKHILVSNDIFNFLSKYDVKVLSLDTNSVTDKTLENSKSEIAKGNIKYIIMLDNDTLDDDTEKFITDNKIEKIYYHSLTTLTKEQRDDGKDYISMMKENLEILKKELYDTE